MNRAAERRQNLAEEMRELEEEAQLPLPVLPASLPPLPAPPSCPAAPKHGPAMKLAKEILAQPYNPGAFRSWISANMDDIRAVFRQTPDSDRAEAMWSKRRIFEFLDASTTKNLDRIKDKEAAIELLSEIDALETDNQSPEDKRKRSKRKRKGRKQADKAFVKVERQAGEKAVDEAAMHAQRGTGEEWLGKLEEPMGTGKGKGKEKAMTAMEDSYERAEDNEDENYGDSLP